MISNAYLGDEREWRFVHIACCVSNLSWW